MVEKATDITDKVWKKAISDMFKDYDFIDKYTNGEVVVKIKDGGVSLIEVSKFYK